MPTTRAVSPLRQRMLDDMRMRKYHAIKFAKYAYRYLAEVHFRFNWRYDLRAILGDLLAALVHAPRRPQRGIRVAERHR